MVEPKRQVIVLDGQGRTHIADVSDKLLSVDSTSVNLALDAYFASRGFRRAPPEMLERIFPIATKRDRRSRQIQTLLKEHPLRK